MEFLEAGVRDRLFKMSFASETPIIVIGMLNSLDEGYALAFGHGKAGHSCTIVPLLPYGADALRSILRLSLGAGMSSAEKKGAQVEEMAAALVDSDALDACARVVSRVSGSARLALEVCQSALTAREESVIATTATAAPSLSSSSSTTTTSSNGNPHANPDTDTESETDPNGDANGDLPEHRPSKRNLGCGDEGPLLRMVDVQAAINSYALARGGPWVPGGRPGPGPGPGVSLLLQSSGQGGRLDWTAGAG
ncbi:unnamed protein product, partial [Discosporangium mesarthrocarpum]